jgi:ParB-like chromosome segregation protein Spo0J
VVRQVRIEKVPVADIVVGKRWRIPNEKQISSLQESLRENGLIMPIGVRLVSQGHDPDLSGRLIWTLVHGATRLAAAKREGWSEIDAQILEGSDADFEKMELAENLHRGELTKLQRDRQIARYVQLCRSEPILRGPRAKSRRGRPKGGLRDVARKLKVAESTARDAMKVANITEPAAAAIVHLGLADNPSAYRAIAAEATVKAQLAKARQIAAGRSKRGPKSSTKAPGPQAAALMAAWTKARAGERREFLRGIGHGDCSAASGRKTSDSSSHRSRSGSRSEAGVKRSPSRPEKRQLELL